MYDNDNNEYEATYNRYSDGGRELMYIKPITSQKPKEETKSADAKATEAILSKEAAQGVGRLKEKYSKKATMELGNGLRLTADVSNPNKNISEVERAKKVNREKQYADKKLNQYRKAAKEEKEKAQSIADAISAKTGIANTGSRNARYDTSRSKKVPSYSTFEKQFLKESGEDVWNMSLERYNFLKKQAKEIYEKEYGKKK